MITIKLFDNIYEITIQDKNEFDFIKHFITTKPTLNEFEDFCWSWKIQYNIKIINNK